MLWNEDENYNENLATNFVGGQLDIYTMCLAGVGAKSISAPVFWADMESALTDSGKKLCSCL